MTFYQNMAKKEQTIKITNNFLPPQSFLMVKALLNSDQLPWYFNNAVVYPEKDPVDHYQLTHTFYVNNTPHSSFYRNLSPLLDVIKPSILIRIKANLLPINSKIIKHEMHNDELSENAKITTGIFYVNTNNGKTIFDTGEEISSEENKYIEFDSRKLHTGTTCTNQKRRMVINFNYIK